MSAEGEQADIFAPGGGDPNARKAFRQSFGDTPRGTVISDPMGVLTGEEGFDVRPSVRKSLDDVYSEIDERMMAGESFRSAMGEVAAAKGLNVGDYSLPVFPLEDLTFLTRRNTPFWDMLPKVAHDSDTVKQDSVAALADAEIGSERSVPNTGDDTIEPKTQNMTYYRVRGSVSGPMSLASSGFRNAMGVEQRMKNQAMAHLSANLVLNGDPQTGDASGGITDERGYKGVRTLAKDNGVTTDAAGSTITPEMVRSSFAKAVADGGDPSAMIHITDWQTITDLKNALGNKGDTVIIQGGPDGTINLGAKGVSVDGTMVLPSDFMPNVPYDSANADTTGREFLTIDMRYHAVYDLSSTVMEMLGKTADADEFFLKRYSTMLQDAGAWEYTHAITNLA